ncbi:MaoC family dehydratase [Auraticoccus sp. F435]|uniref:MaoC family dehydratase n=1 Tax=Auraticoccus cholistanensis TaxID=2656650 RepID=A0A6A9US88_9ACTN|nr:MaoC family dehydratase N-terminal domain-containing protein [Auraticoccus cholistanensis]MVA75561.1 MaoC family dehydratase [Auraticoccus cholistanensis]
MPISAEHVGRRYPATDPYVVSQAKVVEFARALRDGNEVYRGKRPVAPPTFAIVVAGQAWDQMFHDPELGLALERVVHADQGFSWQRPLRVGDEVTATLTIEKVRTRGSADFIGSLVEVSTTDGEPVCEVRATFVHSHPAPEEDVR